jgi:hypothetical protein
VTDLPAIADFGVTATHGLAARAIRLGENINARRRHLPHITSNHAFIYVGIRSWIGDHDIHYSNVPAIVEANPHGAAYAPWDKYAGTLWSTGSDATRSLTDGQRQRIARAADYLVGKPYNWLDDAALAIALTLNDRLVPGPVWRRLSDDQHYECAQLVDAAYRDGGWHLFTDDRPTGRVYPGSLELLIKGIRA